MRAEYIENIATGGQKEVSLYFNDERGKVVKKTGKCSSLASLERIKREVGILESIQSPYFPMIYEFSYDLDGNFVIWEEYIDGQTLLECASDLVTEVAIIDFIIELVKGLSILWNKNIVHRDIKPENLLIRNDNQLKIIDLGIAKNLDAESLTKTHLIMGPCTPVYASPEQLRNDKRAIDKRSDFFSIGILMATLLQRVHPFSPEIIPGSLGIIENILSDKYVIKTISSETKSIINKLLSNKPYNRYRTHKQLLIALEERRKELG